MRNEIKSPIPKLNDIWTAPGAKEFLITNVRLVENDPWVEYRNVETGQEHSCRQEAFLTRFSLKP